MCSYGRVSLLHTVNIFAKLVGMMTDHCAKEKKDVHMLEELKTSAVLQQLGKQKILNSDNQELVPKLYAKYYELISKFGGTGAWNALYKSGSGGCLIPHTSKYDDMVFLCTVGNI